MDNERHLAPVPDQEVTETIEAPLSPADEYDAALLRGDVSPDGEVAPDFHTVLEVWREVLAPAAAEGRKPITPQYATKIVQSYPHIRYEDMLDVRDLYFGLIEELRQILLAEINSDDECLNQADPQEDREHNAIHYKNLLTDWQVKFLETELSWDCAAPEAAAQIAAMSEVHKMFFGDMGLGPYLNSIQFEFTEADQADLAAQLNAVRQASVEVNGE